MDERAQQCSTCRCIPLPCMHTLSAQAKATWTGWEALYKCSKQGREAVVPTVMVSFQPRQGETLPQPLQLGATGWAQSRSTQCCTMPKLGFKRKT
eukprot:243897-Chlamydomonas_euryale.AAC.3